MFLKQILLWLDEVDLIVAAKSWVKVILARERIMLLLWSAILVGPEKCQYDLWFLFISTTFTLQPFQSRGSINE